MSGPDIPEYQQVSLANLRVGWRIVGGEFDVRTLEKGESAQVSSLMWIGLEAVLPLAGTEAPGGCAGS